MVVQPNAKEGAKEPECGGSVVTVHEGISHFLNFLDMAFNGILLLMMRFGGMMTDIVETKNIFNSGTASGFSIITAKAGRGTKVTNVVFKGLGNMGF